LTRKLPKILVYGYGNPGRQDDGLGVMLAEEIARWSDTLHLSNVDTDSNYQLNIEDAAGIANYDIVVFADASMEEMTHFRLDPLKPSVLNEFTMHAVSPAFILYLCHEMFHIKPSAYLLHIRGYAWEFMGEMTVGARENLAQAAEYMKSFILDNSQPIA
jgi:hydrogenase maturation protease